MRKNGFKYFLISATLLLGCFCHALAGDPGLPTTINKDKVDTASAVVFYGEELLFEDLADNLSESRIKWVRDSLFLADGDFASLIDQINLFLSIKTMPKRDVIVLIDSLFNEERAPYALINQINLYVSTLENELVNEEDLWDEENDEFYPANFYYKEWNTSLPNPYKPSLCEADTITKIWLLGRAGLDSFHIPIDDVLTSSFGWRDGRMHKGIDVDLQVWDTVVSAWDGVVRVASFYGGYGRVVVVRHFNGLETTYAHLHRLKVKPGQLVRAGECVGLGGSSGQSTGSHLHFETRFKGVAINPMHFIDYKNQKVVANEIILKKTTNGFAAFPEGSVFYTVRSGDYLQKIALNYGVTINSICGLNGIKRNGMLYVGQKLRVI